MSRFERGMFWVWVGVEFGFYFLGAYQLIVLAEPKWLMPIVAGFLIGGANRGFK